MKSCDIILKVRMCQLYNPLLYANHLLLWMRFIMANPPHPYMLVQ